MAYPILFTCEDSKFIAGDKFEPEDLFSRIIQMQDSERREYLEQVCLGKEDCLQRLQSLVEFSQANYQIAYSLFENELARLEPINGQLIDENPLFGELKNYQTSLSEIMACERTRAQISPDSFITDQGSLLVSYPFHTNYMYVTGCRSVNTRACNPMGKLEVDELIEKAVAVNADPYLIMALTLMEEGTSMGSLYLDPIGIVDAIGCQGRQVANGTENSLNSFGTNYIIEPDSISNLRLSNKLKLLAKDKASEGESYYCQEILGEGGPYISESKDPASCCLQLGFAIHDNDTNTISDGLKYEFIRKRLRAPFRGKSEPQWKAQRYNGYTDLMGAAESVPSWRVGINFYEHPAYGNQVMDYLLNSLMFNPYIRNKVELATKESGSEWESILCQGKSNGTYYYDSSYFMKQVRDSTRLESIYEKYQAGVGFSELSQRERNVMMRELRDTAKYNSKMPNLLRERQVTLYEDEIFDAMDELGGDLFLSETLSAEELWDKIGTKLNIDKSKLTQYVQIDDDIIALQEQGNEKQDIVESLSQEAYQVCGPFNESPETRDRYLACHEDYDNIHCMQNFDSFSRGKCQVSENSDVYEIYLKALPVAQQMSTFRQAERDYRKTPAFKELQSYFSTRQDESLIIMNNRRRMKPLEEQLEFLRSQKGYQATLEPKIRALYDHFEKQKSIASMDEPYQEYFQNIYQNRRTLGQTSDYSWRELSSSEIRKILQKANP